MANFHEAKIVTKAFEGGFWNDPSAGWTYAGITKKFYPSWVGFRRIAQLAKGKEPARHTLFKDATLENMVDDFYKNSFWIKKLTGDAIANQNIANMVYDFILHKENDAIKVINQTAKSFNLKAKTALTSLSSDVIAIMNVNAKQFYSSIRAARIAYYTGSTLRNKKLVPRFSKGLQNAFTQRVNKLPDTI